MAIPGQTAAPELPQPLGPPLDTVESLVAPVALYPDPLLSELLVASTYPVEIVQAARWLDTHPDIETLSGKDWDSSIQRLTQVPSVVKMMNDHLDWTTALGNAFLENPDEVLGAVQTLRGKAVATGFLKDTPQQKVDQKTVKVSVPPTEAPVEGEGETAPAVRARPAVMRQELITIQPAKEDMLYVPQYSPEAAYSAPLAAPPGSGVATPVAATAAYTPTPAAQTYYPTYTPTATTTATSTTNPWLTFGAGALVGGLVTWGIMELADDDWNDGYYRGPVRVAHHYGDAVCYRGNCWNGGGYRGNGYRGDVNIDRGDINLNRNVNVSGNAISRDRTFKLNQIERTHQVWQHDGTHRRGQRYTDKAKDRIGDQRPPDLAGSRLSGLDGIRDGDRGTIGDHRPGAGLTKPGTLPAKRPLSSEDVRAKLSEKNSDGSLTAARDKLADRGDGKAKDKLAQARPEGALSGTRDKLPDRDGQARDKLVQARKDGTLSGARDKLPQRDGQSRDKLAQARNEGAFSGAKERGPQIREQAQRGKDSRQIAKSAGQARDKLASGSGAAAAERVKQRAPDRNSGALVQKAGGKIAERREVPARPEARPELKQRAPSSAAAARSQRIDQMRRAEQAKPSAFGGARDGNQAKNFSQRGTASRQNMPAQRAAHTAAGGGYKRGSGGGINRGSGGGGRARRR